MKKYLVFLVSFAVLFMLFQISSGLLLTTFHTPDPTVIKGALSNEVIFGDAGFSALFTVGIFLAGTVAYLISQKLNRNTTTQEN